MQEDLKKRCWLNGISWAYALPRIGLGMLFLIAGAGKVQTLSAWLSGDQFQHFSKFLPSIFLKPYMVLLPFLETMVGVLLVLGLFTRPALKLTGLLILSINLGLILSKQFAIVSNNFVYLIVISGLLVFADRNGLALDCFRKNKPESN
jgi:thiosulfate dehydrogenase (quinone) large subunit